jgi:hypothetical protein
MRSPKIRAMSVEQRAKIAADPGLLICQHADRTHPLGGGQFVCFACWARLIMGTSDHGKISVTIDELSPGQVVRWIHTPRGGYGFTMPIDAIVKKVCEKRVRIEVLLRDGRRVERVVTPESLRPRLS